MSAATLSAAPAAGTATADRATRGPLRRAWSVVVGTVMAVLLALVAAVVVLPALLGAAPLTVLTGSMEPALSPGDVVVVRPVDPADVHVGDVVTFQPVSDDPSLVTHRVVGVTQGAEGVAGLTTRGDANDAADDPIVPDQVQGRVAYSVPLVGHLTNASWGPTVLRAGAVALLLYGVVAVVTPHGSRRHGRRRTDPAGTSSRQEAS
ncbi:signal peptidase I [Cellulosimicrobium sp. NPDC057862]|uniref:signal peptidase I n=1 Tax=Cellulosimicrobium sp. NPDC057862 TaxID=3346266 RepID=UPI00366E830C